MKLSERQKENLSIVLFILALVFLVMFAFCGGMIVQGTTTELSIVLFIFSGVMMAVCAYFGLMLLGY